MMTAFLSLFILFLDVCNEFLISCIEITSSTNSCRKSFVVGFYRRGVTMSETNNVDDNIDTQNKQMFHPTFISNKMDAVKHPSPLCPFFKTGPTHQRTYSTARKSAHNSHSRICRRPPWRWGICWLSGGGLPFRDGGHGCRLNWGYHQPV